MTVLMMFGSYCTTGGNEFYKKGTTYSNVALSIDPYFNNILNIEQELCRHPVFIMSLLIAMPNLQPNTLLILWCKFNYMVLSIIKLEMLPFLISHKNTYLEFSNVELSTTYYGHHQ